MSPPVTLATIVRALGGDLYAGGARANVPAPGHSAADRSVSLLLTGGRVLVHSFGAAHWREVRDALIARGLLDAAGRLAGAAGARLPQERAHLSPAERSGRAVALWSEAGGLRGTASERYIRSRAVARDLPAGLRHHGAVAAAVYAGRGPRRPALLAAIRDAQGALRAVEVTYLSEAGRRARVRIPRKTVGAVPAGSAVRLDPAGSRMLVAEGVFSALSASEVFRLPAWALLSTSNLRRWTPPAGVRAVLIAADRGADGERSARTLAERLRRLGVAVALRWPPAPFGDWNEAAAASAEGGGRDGKGEPCGREVRTDGQELSR